jgi:hypothetical protein
LPTLGVTTKSPTLASIHLSGTPGTPVAARLASLMDGGITVDSVPGQGSTFAFIARFRLRPHPPERTAASPPILLRGLPVLIVDDNATNRHILEGWLRGYAMEPTAAGNARTARANSLRQRQFAAQTAGRHAACAPRWFSVNRECPAAPNRGQGKAI